ncbi:MAG: hypothetical protein WCL02_03755 [bacterium]
MIFLICSGVNLPALKSIFPLTTSSFHKVLTTSGHEVATVVGKIKSEEESNQRLTPSIKYLSPTKPPITAKAKVF